MAMAALIPFGRNLAVLLIARTLWLYIASVEALVEVSTINVVVLISLYDAKVWAHIRLLYHHIIWDNARIVSMSDSFLRYRSCNRCVFVTPAVLDTSIINLKINVGGRQAAGRADPDQLVDLS